MLGKIFKILYIVLIALFAVSYFQVKKLPERGAVLPELLREPVQGETVRSDFGFKYRGKEYHVRPQAEYELWGLVVSVNNINAWYNYYHDENTVNLKDVCVVWGPNVENGVYLEKEIKFKSGEWTCYYEWSGRLKEKFYPHKLSNNHLLASDEEAQKIIRSLKVGDQIHVKGALVDYAEAGSSWYRRTSLSREDTNQTSRSGGACEVFYADALAVLKKNQPFWRSVNFLSPRLFLILAGINLSLFVFRSLRQQKIYLYRKDVIKTNKLSDR